MLRSLFAGISGLNNHQIMLDIVGNNIANVNTVGYKSQRVTFRELLSQTLSGASRPVPGSRGGTNPQQIGLGAAVQSIDSSFSQGNLQATGNTTDLAIEGDGFFIVNDGNTNRYTRSGSFVFDGLGQLVTPGGGAVLQGVLAGADGKIDIGNPLQNITILDNLVAPARATTSVSLTGNLDADSDAQGSILQSNSYLAVAGLLDTLTSLHSGTSGSKLNVQPGRDISISGEVGGSSINGTFTVQTTSTMLDLVTWLNTIDSNATFTLNSLTGEIDVTAGASDITNLALTVTGNPQFNSAFAFDDNISAGTSGSTVEALRGPAEAGDLLATLYDSKGNQLVLPVGGFIQVDGDRGGVGITPGILSYDINTTTMQDLLDAMDTAFQIANTSGVTIDTDGQIVITGDAGLSAEISDVRLSVPSQADNSFGTAFKASTIQFARDPKTWQPTATIYDSLGRDFQLAFTFTKQTGSNTWDWSVDVPGTAAVTQGGSGSVSFDDQGRLQAFSYTDQSGQLLIDPGNGAQLMQVDLDPGQFGGLSGLIQFKGGFTASARDFEGHGVGTLQSISIDGQGVVTGQFSNGINQALAQIALAEFNNPSGLTRVGDGSFSVSSNTGPESITFVGVNSSSRISPGQLEMSNVDLASEFTQMIIAQRGFQANARIISVGDQILSDLVSLGR